MGLVIPAHRESSFGVNVLWIAQGAGVSSRARRHSPIGAPTDAESSLASCALDYTDSNCLYGSLRVSPIVGLAGTRSACRPSEVWRVRRRALNVRRAIDDVRVDRVLGCLQAAIRCFMAAAFQPRQGFDMSNSTSYPPPPRPAPPKGREHEGE